MTVVTSTSSYLLMYMYKIPKKFSIHKVLKCVLHDFGFRKVSPSKQLLIQQVGFVNLRHFSKTEVVENTDLRI